MSPGESYGHHTSNVGDVTSDGRDDFLICAPNNNVSGDRAGRVYLRNGYSSANLWIASGDESGDRFGWSVAFAELDGNDMPELTAR